MHYTWLDLTLFTGAVYGLAWLVTQSKLFARPRAAVADVPFLGDLTQCIVCTATWVGFAAMAALPWTSLFSSGFRAASVADFLFLTGWVLASSWALGRLFGDAEIDPTEH